MNNKLMLKKNEKIFNHFVKYIMLINIIGSCLKLIKNKMYVIKFLNRTCKKKYNFSLYFDFDYI